MQLGDQPETSSFFREKCKRTRLFRQGQGALRRFKLDIKNNNVQAQPLTEKRQNENKRKP